MTFLKTIAKQSLINFNSLFIYSLLHVCTVYIGLRGSMTWHIYDNALYKGNHLSCKQTGNCFQTFSVFATTCRANLMPRSCSWYCHSALHLLRAVSACLVHVKWPCDKWLQHPISSHLTPTREFELFQPLQWTICIVRTLFAEAPELSLHVHLQDTGHRPTHADLACCIFCMTHWHSGIFFLFFLIGGLTSLYCRYNGFSTVCCLTGALTIQRKEAWIFYL